MAKWYRLNVYIDGELDSYIDSANKENLEVYKERFKKLTSVTTEIVEL